MDIITHSLAGITISKFKKKISTYLYLIIMVGSILPDVGEIPIQLVLSEKNSTNYFIYDNRTSDQIIANQKNITWLYDFTHSILTPLLLISIGYLFVKFTKRQLLGNTFIYFSIGQISHIFLDSFSHGKIWALKLFYPVLDHRFEILAETFGSWWDCTPKIQIPFISFQLPIICIYFWIVICLIILSINFAKNKILKKQLINRTLFGQQDPS